MAVTQNLYNADSRRLGFLGWADIVYITNQFISKIADHSGFVIVDPVTDGNDKGHVDGILKSEGLLDEEYQQYEAPDKVAEKKGNELKIKPLQQVLLEVAGR